MDSESVADPPPESTSGTHLVIFLPFLRLKSEHKSAGVEFLPLRDGDGNVPATLESAVAPLERILSGYIDRHGEPFTNCVIATMPGRGWDLKLLESQRLVVQATNNSKEQFANSSDLKSEVLNAVRSALEAHTTMSTQALSSETVREGLKDVLLGPAQLYETRRQKGAVGGEAP